jgi:hypothetical protein
LDGAQLSWTSSLNGELGTGPSLAISALSLQEGAHTITLTARDSLQQMGGASITIRVFRERPAFPVALSTAPGELTFRLTNMQSATQTVAIRNSGDGELTWSAVADQPWILLPSKSGTAPHNLEITANAAGLALGEYTGQVTIDAPDALGSPEVIRVNLLVQAEPPTKLANISTRLLVQTGDNVLIGGFIVTGTQPKQVIVRAIGPSLNVNGTPVANRLQDTTLELFGPGGSIATNDNWRTTQEAEIIATTVAPQNDLESAIVATLPANGTGYTAIVRGVGGTSGIGLVEVFDLNRDIDSQLANISTRGFILTGDNVMIGGTILLGTSPRRLIVRAIGPSLNVNGVPVPGRLSDSTLDLVNQNGAVIASNDNWRSTQEAEIIATTVPPPNDLEAAIVATLAPASYTAIVRGKDGATGIGLVEVFALSD